MSRRTLVKTAKGLVKKYRIKEGKGFRLKDVDPADTLDFGDEDKPKAREALQIGVERLSRLQEMLYAQDRWGVLVIFQAMDAAGKDGAIKNVLSGVNPLGCQVYSFKAPSEEDLDHDYLWRCMKALPERGRIGIFNRSYYEEVLVVRVHNELLARQKLPSKLIHRDVWDERYEDIRNIERYLTRNGFAICKFFLHLSKNEQKRRFLERIENPDKNWKFSVADAMERGHWKDYQHAYQEMIRATATPYAPWHVIPADNKWFTRVAISAALVDTLNGLGLEFPEVSKKKKQELADIRDQLLNGA